MRRTIAIVAAGLLLLGACSDSGGGGEAEPDAPDTDASPLSVSEGAPPWPLGKRQADRIRAVELPLLKSEGSVVHYHAHLDVFYDGERVTVPANIGVDFDEKVISPLHTHTPSGVIHVEANEEADFTLSHLLTEWGVKVGDGCVADKCGDEVAVFVDGSIQDVFAGDLVIKPQSQITLVLGTEPVDIPSEYDCKAEQPSDMCSSE